VVSYALYTIFCSISLSSLILQYLRILLYRFRGAYFPILCYYLYTGPFLTAVSVLVIQLAVLNSDSSDSRAAISRRSIKE
jgi:hypothetical protein